MRKIKILLSQWIHGPVNYRVQACFDIEGIGEVWCQSIDLGTFTEEIFKRWVYGMQRALMNKYDGRHAPGLFEISENSWLFSE